MKLFFFPDFTENNPYQNLLYSKLRECGHSVLPGSIDDAIDWQKKNTRSSTVFHIHWQNVVTAVAADSHQHRLNAFVFLKKVELFKTFGGNVVWTIHNRLPHDAKFMGAEREFHSSLGGVSDLILVHDKSSIDIILSEYSVPREKIKVIKHGNYINAYRNDVTGDAARSRLGIPKEDFVFGFVGQMRPYKGLDEFVDACFSLSSEADVSALIAGKPVWPISEGQISQMCAPLPMVRVVEGYIPDDELQIYLNSIDVLVLPYKDILTSGSVVLAASFGLPIIVPDIPSFSTIKDYDFVYTYDSKMPGSLASTIKRVAESNHISAKGEACNALEYARSLDWSQIGLDFLGCIEELDNTMISKEVSYQGYTHRIECSEYILKNTSEEKFAICVVNYFSSSQIETLLSSITNWVKQPHQIFVLDNSCDTREFYRLASVAKGAVLVKAEDNIGYAAGNNVLINVAIDHGYKYFSILNPDVEFTEDVYRRMLPAINMNTVQMCSPLILKSYDTVSFFRSSISKESTTLDISHECDGFSKASIGAGLYESDTLNGCSLFFHKDFIEKYGYIPEEYFLYFEETDWTFSVRSQGGTLVVDSNTSLIHNKQTQSGGLPAIAYTYYLLRNSLIFADKYGFDVHSTEYKYRRTFVEPWLSNIRVRANQFESLFSAICEMAFFHGHQKIFGPVDILQELRALKSSDSSSEGFVDDYVNGKLSGWAVSDTTAGADSANLLLLSNGNLIKSFSCDIERDDIASLGYSSMAGFSIDLELDVVLSDFEVIDAETFSPLHRTPQIQDKLEDIYIYYEDFKTHPGELKARIDGYKNGRVNGWALDLRNRLPLEIEVLIDGELAGGAIADGYREDLKVAGLNGGNCHFSVVVNPKFLTLEQVDISLRVLGSDNIICSRKLSLGTDLGEYDVKADMKSFLTWSYTNVMSPHGWFEYSDALLRECDFMKQSLACRASIGEGCDSGYLISIIMPVFNRDDVIEIALQSVLQQTYENYELIIVDDGSEDRTCDVVESYINKHSLGEKFRLIKSPANLGVSSARNIGLSQACGDIVAYLDSDNEWDEDYLAIVNYTYMCNSSSDSAYAGQEVWFYDRNHGAKFRTNVRMLPFNRSLIENSNFIDLNVFSHRLRLVEEKGGFREDVYRLVDWELILKYTKESPPVFIPALLSKYYFGLADNQITSTESYDENLGKILKGLV